METCAQWKSHQCVLFTKLSQSVLNLYDQSYSACTPGAMIWPCVVRDQTLKTMDDMIYSNAMPPSVIISQMCRIKKIFPNVTRHLRSNIIKLLKRINNYKIYILAFLTAIQLLIEWAHRSYARSKHSLQCCIRTFGKMGVVATNYWIRAIHPLSLYTQGAYLSHILLTSVNMS